MALAALRLICIQSKCIAANVIHAPALEIVANRRTLVEMRNQEDNGENMRWSSSMLRTITARPISLIFLISTELSILLDIPVFRQILGFIFLAFVPGALFLCILKPDKLGLTEKFVLSVGLSISFIMFISVLINTLYPLFGYETPLSLKSLVISLTFALLILAVIAHLRGGFAFFVKRTDPRLDTRDKALVLIPILFIPLSVLGMHLMNTTDKNAMLMALLFLIPVYVILISVLHNHIPENAYPLIIFMTSISLVLLMGMRSSHIIGADAHTEYYIFQQTFSNEKWQILVKGTLDSCLSISILPMVYQSFLNTNPEYLFKILYPLLFSISPLVVYIITKEYLDDIYAFLASVFFMSHTTFLGTTANPRTTIAILFVALSIMVLIDGRLSVFEKRLLLIIFIFSCIVSHYSTTYIFFGLLLFAFISVKIIYKLDEQNIMDSTLQTAVPGPSKSYLTPGVLTIFFVVIFVWYSQVTGAAFDSGVGFLVNSMRSLQDFFILESRQEGVTMAFGSGFGGLEVPRKISFVFNWLTIFFIAIGVLTTLFRYQQRVALSSRNVDDSSGLLTKKIDIVFFALAIICSAIMVASVALPFVSKGYGIDRAYLLTTVVLSSFFVLGGMTVAELIRARWKYLVVLVVLVPFFMCATGTMYQVFGYPGSITLNSEGQQYDVMYIHDQESISAKWLKDYAQEYIRIYADWYGTDRLISQGIRTQIYYAQSLIEDKKAIKEGYIFIRYTGVVDGKLMDRYYKLHNITDYEGKFGENNIIYDNGGSEIYK